MVESTQARADLRLDEAYRRISALVASEVPELELETAGRWGRFEGELDTHMLDDGRRCELLADYGYHRPDARYWLSPKGTIVDGASIPQPLWSLVGGPFEGRYRNASVIHDHYCDTHERSWRETHRTFYEAMRCSAVSAFRAKLMYYAVYRFGPRWPDPGAPVPEGVITRPSLAPQQADAASLLSDVQTIHDQHLSLDAIEQRVDRLSP